MVKCEPVSLVAPTFLLLLNSFVLVRWGGVVPGFPKTTIRSCTIAQKCKIVKRHILSTIHVNSIFLSFVIDQWSQVDQVNFCLLSNLTRWQSGGSSHRQFNQNVEIKSPTLHCHLYNSPNFQSYKAHILYK